MDDRERRLAQNEALFREVNEGAADVHMHWAEAGVGGATIGIVCECGQEACVETIEVPPEEYERVRANPARFIVLDGHEIREVEDVVDRHQRYVVVEKVGPARRYAERLDPRSR